MADIDPADWARLNRTIEARLARSIVEGAPPSGSHDFYAGRCVRCDLRVADAGYTCSGFAVAPTVMAALVEARAERDRYREALKRVADLGQCGCERVAGEALRWGGRP